MSFYSSVIRPLLFRCDPEWVHDQSIRACAWAGSLGLVRNWTERICACEDRRLNIEVAGIRFANPVGLAAGYDKSGKAIDFMSSLGFGFVEIGSISADPSSGNPRPRLWRFPEDAAIGVHYGLPNDGAEVVARRLDARRATAPLGINIVKTNRGLHAPPDDAETILFDYLRSVSLLHQHASYLCLNLSCPNTEMGRDFFADRGMLTELLTRLREMNLAKPVFLKVSPSGGIQRIEELLAAVDPFALVSGFMFNLPSSKPVAMRTPREVWEKLPGAVAGAPVREVMRSRVRELYQRMDRARYHIMAAGGILTADDAYDYLRQGASLVQVFTGMIYEGPMLVKRVNEGLCELLARDGFTIVKEAVGSAHETRTPALTGP